MAKHSTNHVFHKWAQRRSTEALAALVAQYAPRRAAALLTGRTYSSGSPVLDLQLAAAAAELDRRRASEAVIEAARLRDLGGSPQQIRRGQRDETAYRVNRIREATHRELEYRRTKPSDGEGPALGSQTQQSGTERLHRTVPKGRRQTRSQPVER